MADNKTDAKPETQAAATTPKRRKINDLTLAEIESRLATCREKQGSLFSKYARQLLARKKTLAS